MNISQMKDPKETVLCANELVRINSDLWTLPAKKFVYQCACLDSVISGEFRLPKTFEGVGMSAFAESKKMYSWKAQRGSKLEYIGSRAFAGCENMDRIEIPHTVKEIGSYAFKNCTHLRELILPEGLEKIGEGFAEGCYHIKKIVCGEKVFDEIYRQSKQIADLSEIICLRKNKRIETKKIQFHGFVNVVLRPPENNDYDELAGDTINEYEQFASDELVTPTEN